jgi:hypothetical protein
LTVAELDGEDVKQAGLEIDEVELPPQSSGAGSGELSVVARLQALVARLAQRFNISAKGN